MAAAISAMLAAGQLLQKRAVGFQMSFGINLANLCFGIFQALTGASLLWLVVPLHLIGMVATWFAKSSFSGTEQTRIQEYIDEQFKGKKIYVVVLLTIIIVAGVVVWCFRE